MVDIASITSATGPSASSSAFSQLTDNFDTFLTLLTTQLRNQDPLEPLDTEQFTEQLVQFAGVEQSIQTNSNLEALIALQSTTQTQASLNLVDRIVSVNGGDAFLTTDANTSINWRYTLPQTANNLTLNVMDSNGQVVTTLQGPSSVGSHNLVWSGQLANGTRAPAGTYRLEAVATDNNGDVFTPVIETRGRVDSIILNNDETLSANAPQISIGGRLVSLDAITRIDAAF